MNIVVDEDTFARMLERSGLAVGTDLEGDPIDPFTGLTSTTDPLELLAELLDHPDDPAEIARLVHLARTRLHDLIA